VLRQLADDDGTGRVRELGKLLQMHAGNSACAGTLERRADEQCPLSR
jgi:hypothetical protein